MLRIVKKARKIKPSDRKPLILPKPNNLGKKDFVMDKESFKHWFDY